MDNNTASEIAAHLIAIKALLERAKIEGESRSYAYRALSADLSKGMGDSLKGLAQTVPHLARALGGFDAQESVTAALRGTFPTVG